jgi:RNA-directed DNA polymerase
MNEAKPFCISKKEVWEAYQRVKENKGAAGIDEQSIEDFERKLKKNLYKIWNRMSSGSYFPPPVRTVKIPKKKRWGKKAGHSHSRGSNRTTGRQSKTGASVGPAVSC